MRVLEHNASDGVKPIILIQFGSLYLTRLVLVRLHSIEIKTGQIYNFAAKNLSLALSWQLNSVLERNIIYRSNRRVFLEEYTEFTKNTISYLDLHSCCQLSTHMLL